MATACVVSVQPEVIALHRDATPGVVAPDNDRNDVIPTPDLGRRPMKKNDTLLRQWRMLREVPRHPRRISSADLLERLAAAGFATSLRTVQRDLIKLSTALPLLADDAKPQGWSWQADAPQLDLPTLEPQAALVFHFAEHYLQPILPASTLEYLAPWFRTAAGVLDNHGNGLSTWRRKVRVLAPRQPMLPPTVAVGVQAAVTQALLSNRQIAVAYRPRGAKEDRHYEANLLGLVVRDQVIYLVCTLRNYEDVRQLVLNRISSAELLDKPTRQLKGFDLDRYIAEGGFGVQVDRGRKIDLIADFDRPVAIAFIERPLDEDQVLEDVDENTVRLRASLPDTRELRRWLLEFGARAEVLAPESLRKDMQTVIEQMYRRYQNNSR